MKKIIAITISVLMLASIVVAEENDMNHDEVLWLAMYQLESSSGIMGNYSDEELYSKLKPYKIILESYVEKNSSLVLSKESNELVVLLNNYHNSIISILNKKINQEEVIESDWKHAENSSIVLFKKLVPEN